MLTRLLTLLLLVYMLWRWLGGSFKTPHKKKEKSPYAILNIDEAADEETIRDAYQRLVAQYHPDKVEELGPELKMLAEEKTKEINAAYEKLKKSK